MRILSWNIWIKNQNPIGNLKELIEHHKPDVICLQEVTADLLEYVHDASFEGFDYIYSFDYRKHKQGYYQNYYLVTLSKHPIQNQKVNRLHVNHLTRWSLWDAILRWDESIEFLYADIRADDEMYRVFNCHLEVSAGPKLRLNQFQQTLNKFSPDSHNIVCGDFNIFATLWINIAVGWMLGFSPSEIFMEEREEFEKVFSSHKLTNPLLGQPTYPKRKLQLDHIIIPEELNRDKQEVIKNLYGSDHNPILVEI